MEAAARYHPDREQLAIANAFNAALADLLPIDRLHRSNEEDAKTWAALESLGVFGVAAEEEFGGSNLGAAEEVLIVLELGRRLVSPAVLSAVAAVHAPLPVGGRRRLGRRVAAGFRQGERIVVVADSEVETVLIRSEGGAAIFESPTLAGVVDDQLWTATLRELAAPGRMVAEFEPQALLRLMLIDAAALAGVAQAAIDMSVAYAGLREQFGRPIGAFQAVKHHCANMAIAARCAGDQVRFAAIAVDDAREDAAFQVACALLVAATAAVENAGKNIQLHGGIGFSDEADPHLVLKRAQLLTSIAGGLEAATDRVANLDARC